MLEKKSNGSRLFLTELLFSILFFIIIVAVCTQLLAKAHVLSLQSSELTGAVNACENVAERFLSGADVSKPFRLDEKFHECEDGKYEMSCELSDEISYMKVHIILKDLEKDYVVYDIYTSRVVR